MLASPCMYKIKKGCSYGWIKMSVFFANTCNFEMYSL